MTLVADTTIMHQDCGGTLEPMHNAKHEVLVMDSTGSGKILLKRGRPRVYQCNRCGLKGELAERDNARG